MFLLPKQAQDLRIAFQNRNLDNSNDIFQNHRNLKVNAQKMRMLSEIASSIVV